MSDYLEFAVSLASKAGTMMMEAYHKPNNVHEKKHHELVTDTDRSINQMCIDEISRKSPDHSIMTEEADLIDRKNSSLTWVIDPIDGTNNFVHKIPFFCISIALVEANEIVLGVIYDPIHDELFTTEKGKGSFMNGKPINVSKVKDEAWGIIIWGHGHDIDDKEDMYREIDELKHKWSSFRGLGSAALELAYIASGRCDASIIFGERPWDSATGVLLIREAGGRITHPNGQEYVFGKEDLVATNGFLHDGLIKEINND